MPRQTCTVCAHQERSAIDAAITRGSPPLREIAKQCGLSLTAVFRHKQHMVVAKASTMKNIPEEIRKLRIMLAKAKRKGDTSGALSISREIRAWLTLEAKSQDVTASDSGNAEELSRSEALALAKAIIEGQLEDPDVVAWLTGLMERVSIAAPFQPEEQ